MEDFSFLKLQKQHLSSPQDIIELLRLFKIKTYAPGERFFPGTEHIDSFNVLLKGRIGIYYPDKD